MVPGQSYHLHSEDELLFFLTCVGSSYSSLVNEQQRYHLE